MSAFIVLAFMLGQFIALFNWTNVGSALAVAGRRRAGVDRPDRLPGDHLLHPARSVLNLFIVSGSSMWTLMGAVFVPMFALLGYEPGFIQAAFRVGDSATQVITPMNPYILIFLVMLQRYEPDAGLGTVISRMLPFVVPFWVSWVAVLSVFYLTGLDVGPGSASASSDAPGRASVADVDVLRAEDAVPGLAHRVEPALRWSARRRCCRRPSSSRRGPGPSRRRSAW